LVAPVGIEPTS